MLLQAFKGADYLFIVTEGGVVDPKAELQQGMNAADAAEQARPCTDAKASECCAVQKWRSRNTVWEDVAKLMPDFGVGIVALPALPPAQALTSQSLLAQSTACHACAGSALHVCYRCCSLAVACKFADTSLPAACLPST